MAFKQVTSIYSNKGEYKGESCIGGAVRDALRYSRGYLSDKRVSTMSSAVF